MNKKSPLITVLMAVYNGEKYLREAIESILTQSYTDFEFLIINDGSSDRTEEIIVSYNDERIRYIKNDKNLKLIASLNKGLDLAKGEYIARMDADDISLPNRLEKQVIFMENNISHVLIGSRIHSFGAANDFGSLKLNSDEIVLKLISNNCIYHSTVMLRTKLLKSNRYNKNYLHAEDYEFWTRCSQLGKLEVIEDVLLKYRVHSESISQSNYLEQYEIVKKIRKEILLESINDIGDIEFEIYNKFLNSATNDYFKNIELITSYSKEVVLTISSIILKIEKGSESPKLISESKFSTYLKSLLFLELIERGKLKKRNMFYYFSSNSFSYRQFSKKNILKWILLN